MKLIVLCIVAILCVPGCANQYKDIRVETAADPKVNLAGYRTYAWAAAAAAVHDPEDDWTPPNLDIGAEIKFLVDREMRARKMSEVVDAPNLLLMYAVGVDMKALDVVVESGDGAKQFQEVPRGGLMIILADPASRKVIWAGAAVADLQEAATEDLTKKRLDYAVRTMFAKFPGG